MSKKIALQILEPTDVVTTWPEIQQIIKDGDLPKIRRSSKGAEVYHAFKKTLQDKNITVVEHVMKQLNWDTKELDQLNNNYYFNDMLKTYAALGKRDYFQLLLNDFPYNFEPNVKHLLVWSKIRLPIYEDESINLRNKLLENRIEDFLTKNVANKLNLNRSEYDWFINYTVLQSVAAVSHIHVLVKFKTVEDCEAFDLKRLQDLFEPL